MNVFFLIGTYDAIFFCRFFHAYGIVIFVSLRAVAKIALW